MHNAAFREQQLDLVYVALPTRPADLHRVVHALGAVGAVGANVTVPHKETVRPLCDVLSDEAELVGAVNTLVWDADGLRGDNTDAAGLGHVLGEELGIGGPDGAIVLGTGGAARAAVVALGRLGCAVTVAGRRPDAAEELAGLAELAGAAEVDALDSRDEGDVAAAIGRCRLVVNATPLGMAGEELPAPFHRLGPVHVAYDLIYNPPETPFLAAARAAGAEAHHGLGMLVGQAAASYRLWTGQEPPRPVLSAAAAAALFDRPDAGSRSGT
ncbi:MAG: shikimate dehydrogenase [Actinobacteria bacterium]|nr:shikimate dehydrogenase [Actinomycetota bacterium]